jgi:hypothetical protein
MASPLERLLAGDVSPDVRAKIERAKRALAPLAPASSSRREESAAGGRSAVEQAARARLPVIAGSFAPLVTTSETQVKPIKRIKMKHRRVVALHVEGLSYAEIAHVTGLAPVTIGAIIRNPTIKSVLTRIYAEYDELIKGLKPLVYEALRDTLRNGSRESKLKAIDRWGKITGEFKDEVDAGQTAEEVVKMLLRARHQAADGSVTEITVGGQVG